MTSKIGHWLHFGLQEQHGLYVYELKEYLKEALELEKAYFKPTKEG